jgi:PEP-CTERM motif-containing protein
MRRSILNLGLAALLVSAAAVTAPILCYATPINYTVSGTTDLGNDGNTETITGSFTFDISNGTATQSNATITLSGGDASFDGTFTDLAAHSGGFLNEIDVPFGPHFPTVGLIFQDILNVSPDKLTEVAYVASSSSSPVIDRTHVTGSATFAPAAVPEPSSIALLATGLLGLGLLLYRRRVS